MNASVYILLENILENIIEKCSACNCVPLSFVEPQISFLCLFASTYCFMFHPGSVDNLLNSDHRPVFGSFTVGIASPFIQNRASLQDNFNVKFIFKSVEALVRLML